MPDGSDRPKLPPLPKKETADYDVGYGKPPKEARFKPGQSGNPRGRPKGAKNKKSRIPAQNEERLKQVLLEECYREIGVRDGEKLVKMPVIRAVLRNMALNAAKGNQRSQRMLTENLQWVERERKAEYDEYLKTAIEHKLNGEKELARREELGVTGPRLYPHPDDIIINFATSEVEFRGPISKDEDDYVQTFRLKIATELKIADAEDDLSDTPNSKTKKMRLESLRSTLAKIVVELENHPGRGRFEGIELPPLT
jgi:hypothetical protein